MDKLLQEITLVQQKYELLRSKEESFNLFSVLHKSRDEKNLHSRFIAYLLDPNSSHKLKNTFLKLFLSVLEDTTMDGNWEAITVYPQESDKKEYKYIDILIINRKAKKAIIIENKIDASDSNHEDKGQLETYFKRIRDEEQIPKENIRVYYLTPDRREPSPASLGEFKTLENMNGKCIDYPTEIQDWLEKCLPYTEDKPHLKAAIIQYQKLINIMTHNEMVTNERIDLQNKIGESMDSLKAAKYMFDNFKHIKWHTVFDFYQELAIRLTENGFEIQHQPSEDTITTLTHKRNNLVDDGIEFTANEGSISLFVWCEEGCYLYWGIEDKGLSEQNRTKFDNIDALTHQVRGEYKNWVTEGFDDEKEQIYLHNFEQEGTFNLINKEYRTQIIGRIVEALKSFLA